MADVDGRCALHSRGYLRADHARVPVERQFRRFCVVARIPPVPARWPGRSSHHGVCLPSGVLDSAAGRWRRSPTRAILRVCRRSQQSGLGDIPYTKRPRPRTWNGRGRECCQNMNFAANCKTAVLSATWNNLARMRSCI